MQAANSAMTTSATHSDITVSQQLLTSTVLTIAEYARRGDLDGAEGAQVIQHHAPVAVHTGEVHKRPDVDRLTGVTDTRADGDSVVT